MNASPEYSRGYLRYALGLLVAVYTFNFIDRQIVVILQESIKKEMGLSDGQLGLLSGFTFAIFYVTLGLPIARIADRGVRRNVIAWAVGFWSLMTAIAGFVQSFPQLVAVRIGVGIGEAGGSPPARALISDYYPPRQRGRALTYGTGNFGPSFLARTYHLGSGESARSSAWSAASPGCAEPFSAGFWATLRRARRAVVLVGAGPLPDHRRAAPDPRVCRG